MLNESSNPDRPTEGWWERELLRNQKLVDKYMSLADPDIGFHNPDSESGSDDPFDEFPAMTEEEAVEVWQEEDDDEDDEDILFASEDDLEDMDGELVDELDLESDHEDAQSDFFDLDNMPPDNEGYPEIAQQARRFANLAADLQNIPHNPQVFYMSAGNIGANLAGGHGLGYDEDTICGNIVKCRWALSDCEFCREMLEQWTSREPCPQRVQLLNESRLLSRAIRERIERLRTRVWW